jgi:hypothetical protein
MLNVPLVLIMIIVLLVLETEFLLQLVFAQMEPIITEKLNVQFVMNNVIPVKDNLIIV